MKKFLGLILRIFISGVLIFLLFLKLGKEKLALLPEYFIGAQWAWIGAGVLLFLSALFFGTVRWQLLLGVQGIKVPLASLFALNYIGFFFSNFLPGVVGGDLVKLYYLGRKTKKMSAVFSSVFMDRATGLLALLTIAVIALLLNLERMVVKGLLVHVLAWLLLLISIFAILLHKKSLLLFSEIIKIKRFRIGERIKNIINAFQLYGSKKKILLQSYLLSILLQLEMVIIAYSLALAFRLPIPLLYFFLFFPLIAVIMSLPISISGIGTREWAYILFFSKLPGISEIDALALSLGLYFLTLFTSLWGGIIYIVKGGEIKGCATSMSE